jgi:hypothetical protein
MATSAMLSVKRFSLVESTAMTQEQFGVQAKRQWCVGTHRISVQIIAAASSHPLGSSPPKQMNGIALGLDGMLSMPISPAKTSFPLLVKVVAHPGSGPGIILGIATLDPTHFFTQLAGAAARAAVDGNPHGHGGASVSETSQSFGDLFSASYLHFSVPVYPNTGLNTTTIYGVAAVELTALGTAGGPLDSLVHTPGLTLEYCCGPLRLSTVDLYFPQFAQITQGITVSNVICACNVSSVHLWVNVQTTVPHLAATPSGGLVLRPGQRAYFAVTLQAPNTPSSPIPTAASPRDPSPVVLLPSAGGSSTVEIYCVEVDTSEAHPPTILTVHDDAPRLPEELTRPYHYWLNGSCLTNRPLPSEEGVYVRSVLPVFAVDGESGDDAAECSTGWVDVSASVVPAAAAVTPGQPWPARRVVVDRDSAGLDGSRGAAPSSSAAATRVVPSNASRLIVDIGNRACRCTLKMGIIPGAAIPSPRVCGAYQPGYRAIVTATDPTWSVEVGETPVILPHPLTGDIDFSPYPFVVKKAAKAQPHQCLRVTLMEVTNAATNDAEPVPMDPSVLDEVPIAVGILTLYPLHRSAMLRPIAVPLLFLESFSRYDDMASTGLAVRGSDITFVPIEAR